MKAMEFENEVFYNGRLKRHPIIKKKRGCLKLSNKAIKGLIAVIPACRQAGL